MALISVRQTVHICLHNTNNEFCYLISTLQRAHACLTINRVCRRLKELSKDTLITETLNPLEVYAELTPNNMSEQVQMKVYQFIKQWLPNYINNIVSSKIHGYIPEYFLTYILLPCLHRIATKEEFRAIISELHIEPNNIQRLSYAYTDALQGDDSFVQPTFRNQIVQMYTEMLADIPETFEKQSFVCSVLELYPDKDTPYSGHAAAVIKDSNGRYIVIDDTRVMQPIETFYEQLYERLWKIEVRDIDEATKNNFNNLFRSISKTGVYSQFVDKISKISIEFDDIPKAQGMAGGGFNEPISWTIEENIEQTTKCCPLNIIVKYMSYIILVILIVLVVYIIKKVTILEETIKSIAENVSVE